MKHVEGPSGFPTAGPANSDRRNKRRMSVEDQKDGMEGLTEREIRDAGEALVNYLRQQRAYYYPLGESLTPRRKSFLERFFEPSLLGQVRIVQMAGDRVANPVIFEIAAQMGVKNLPDLKHQSVVTFHDVIVFNEKSTERALFHGLVHATQVQVLGIERFARLMLCGFLRAKSYFMIPLKAHAFSLDCQFAEHPERGFSVETEVSRWAEQDRY